jgi:hypothetical protein
MARKNISLSIDTQNRLDLLADMTGITNQSKLIAIAIKRLVIFVKQRQDELSIDASQKLLAELLTHHLDVKE